MQVEKLILQLFCQCVHIEKEVSVWPHKEKLLNAEKKTGVVVVVGNPELGTWRRAVNKIADLVGISQTL